MKQEYIQQCLSSSFLQNAIDKYAQAEENKILDYLSRNDPNVELKYRKASVLIPLVRNKQKEHWDVILTKRSVHLKHHAGEISFPGGGYEKIDEKLINTAKRETQEEIGIEPSQIQIIGSLPKQKTISGYLVTPYVGIVDPLYQLKVDRNEVEEAFLVPLSFILDPNNHETAERKIEEQSFSYYVIKYNQYQIWGATAQMMVNLSLALK